VARRVRTETLKWNLKLGNQEKEIDTLKSLPPIACLIVMLAFLASVARAYSGTPSSDTAYHLVAIFPIGGEGSWDEITVDSEMKRIYVAHGDQVEVLDEDSGKSLGIVAGTPGVHAVAIANGLKRGFASNGRDSSVTIFDTETLKTIKKVPVNDPDSILYESFTKRVFPMNRKTSVLDAVSGEKVGEIDIGGDPEAAVADGKGLVYINLEHQDAIAVIDAQLLKVVKTYPIQECKGPRSMSYDPDLQRLFVSCGSGSMAEVDAKDGRTIDHSTICSNVDGSEFDSARRIILESCSEGVISVVKEVVPGDYELIETIKTQLYAKTMAIDSKTRKIFLPTADIESYSVSDSQQPYRKRIIPGTFRVLVLAP